MRALCLLSLIAVIGCGDATSPARYDGMYVLAAVPYQTQYNGTSVTVTADTLVLTSTGTKDGYWRAVHMASPASGVVYLGDAFFDTSRNVAFSDPINLDAALVSAVLDGTALTVKTRIGATLVYTRR